MTTDSKLICTHIANLRQRFNSENKRVASPLPRSRDLRRRHLLGRAQNSRTLRHAAHFRSPSPSSPKSPSSPRDFNTEIEHEPQLIAVCLLFAATATGPPQPLRSHPRRRRRHLGRAASDRRPARQVKQYPVAQLSFLMPERALTERTLSCRRPFGMLLLLASSVALAAPRARPRMPSPTTSSPANSSPTNPCPTVRLTCRRKVRSGSSSPQLNATAVVEYFGATRKLVGLFDSIRSRRRASDADQVMEAFKQAEFKLIWLGLRTVFPPAVRALNSCEPTHLERNGFLSRAQEGEVVMRYEPAMVRHLTNLRKQFEPCELDSNWTHDPGW